MAGKKANDRKENEHFSRLYSRLDLPLRPESGILRQW